MADSARAHPDRATGTVTLAAGIPLVGASLLAILLLLESSPRAVAVAAVVASATSLWVVYQANRRDPWCAAFVVLLVVVVFHVGATVFTAVGVPPPFPAEVSDAWYFSDATRGATELVSVCVLAYAAGALGVAALTSAPARAPEGVHPVRVPLARIGFGALVIGVGGWFVIVVSAGGSDLLTASYQSFLSGTAASLLFVTYLLMASGLGLCAMAEQRTVFVHALVVFALFSVVALPLGLRGEVLFPLVAAGLVRSRFVRLPRLAAMLLAAVLVLSMATAVKEVRQSGLAEARLSEVGLSPATGLAELGSTLRVVTVVQTWHGPEPLAGGRTYLAPFSRPFRSYVLGVSVPPARADPDLLNVVIARREGNIGGSIIAEAYHNGGRPGAMAVLGLLGGALTLLRRRATPTRQAVILALVAAPLLNHVRNGFVGLPMGVGVTAALMVVALIAAALGAERVARRR